MLQKEVLNSKALNFKGLNLKGIEDTVLATIINKKVYDVESLKPNGERSAPLVSLEKALSNQDGRNFILECKRSSPTLGDFCKDFDLDKILACYENKASAISVLCEEHFFKGSIEFLKYVKARTTLPVICKDFIICKAQIDNAYIAGADAILLMLSVLTKDTYKELLNYAHQKGLDVLTEVDTYEDAIFAKELNLKIVGINNRDLRTLKVDLNNARTLAKLFSKDTLVVSESGIHTHNDLLSLKGINNFLIGSSLTGSEDIEFQANTMLYGTNKVCGITTKDALQAVINNHAALAGFIFCEKSPRNLSVDKAKELSALAHGKIKTVGVFVDESIEKMVAIAKEVGLDFLQLHGNETVQTIETLNKLLPQVKIIKAFNIEGPKDFEKLHDYEALCEYFILDSKSPGSGTSFDWGKIPANINKDKILLSGGIGLDNVEKALEFEFIGLDLNSKLETVKGIKDVNKINKIFNIIHNY